MRARIVILGCIALGGAASAALAGTLPTAPARTLSANRRAAARDARQRLQSLRLPPGAVSVGHEPAGDHGWLQPLTSILASQARAGVHAWWEVRATPSAVLRYVQSHPPAGASKFESGSGSDRGGSTEQDVGYTWPALPGVLTARLLRVTVTALPGGHTGVLAQAQSDWLVPRPASERVPAGVRSVLVTERTSAGRPPVTRTVTNPGKIHQIVALFDAMPIVQPEVMGCPAFVPSRTGVITVRFRGARARTLAEASYAEYLPGPSRQCNPVTFSVDGRPRTPLIGGDFVRQLARIIGTNLTG